MLWRIRICEYDTPCRTHAMLAGAALAIIALGSIQAIALWITVS